MRRVLKGLVVVLGAVGFWRLLAWWRGKPQDVDPLTLILNPDEANRPGRFVRDISSVKNLRDIGGYTTEDGQVVRWGRVYRGASLAELTPEDSTRLQQLELKIICDLRTVEEAAAAPNIMPAGSTYLPMPTNQQTNRFDRLRVLLFQRHRLGDTLIESYTRLMIDGNALLLGDWLRRIADEANLPLMIHCSAGKDRTGIAIALLLRLLGVPEKTVLEDYSLSNLSYDYFKQITGRILRQLSFFGISEAEARPLLLANPTTLEAAFRHIDAHYGSVEKYLITAAGLDAATLDRIRAVMLEKSA